MQRTENNVRDVMTTGYLTFTYRLQPQRRSIYYVGKRVSSGEYLWVYIPWYQIPLTYIPGTYQVQGIRYLM